MIKRAKLTDILAGKTHEISSSVVTPEHGIILGRGRKSHIVLGEGLFPKEEKELGLDTVSREQATLVRVPGKPEFYIRDEESMGGTAIGRGGVLIPLEPHKLYDLQTGDKLYFGGKISSIEIVAGRLERVSQASVDIRKSYGPVVYEEISEGLKAA